MNNEPCGCTMIPLGHILSFLESKNKSFPDINVSKRSKNGKRTGFNGNLFIYNNKYLQFIKLMVSKIDFRIQRIYKCNKAEIQKNNNVKENRILRHIHYLIYYFFSKKKK